jgi:AraC family transcriptional regulator of adaptative response/methylated-DNA-[protein]-cysteine methyltransferase
MMSLLSLPSDDGRVLTTDDECWADVAARRVSGAAFVYAVTTTGIYCRSTCSSRRPLRANVRFFASAADAVAAGFRACLRCRPDGASHVSERAQLIERICRMIDAAEALPSLDELAAEAGMSPYHFHRLFRATVGVTPRAYAVARRRARLQRSLPHAATVTDAAYDAGYNSSSRFYANATDELGMSPRAARTGGANAQIRAAVGMCSLGTILVAATERGVCAIDLGDDASVLRAGLVARFPRASITFDDVALESHIANVIALVDGTPGDPAREIALDIAGTAFSQRVWAALREIPYGTTATYSDIARTIGAPGSARAVARACAANPVALTIPCHRVVRNDGTISGYRWGPERKRALLQRESERKRDQ